MRAALASSLLAALLLIPCSAWALALTIQPYLQLTDAGVCVLWKTDGNSDSLLEYGRAPDRLTEQSYSSGSRTLHQECPSGLAAGTTWYYRIGATGDPLTTASADYYFKAVPDSDSEELVRIWVVSDIHSANMAWYKSVAAYERFSAGRPADIVVSNGDSFGQDGADDDTIATTINSMASVLRHTLFMPTMGNHDVGGSAKYFEYMALPENGVAGEDQEAYYSYDYGPVHLIALNGVGGSYPIYDGVGEAVTDQYTWLAADLAANTADWLIVNEHYAPYSNGWFPSDTTNWMEMMREEALPLLEANGLDLMVNGHSHNYERSYFLNGHYGLQATFVAATHIVQPGTGGCCGMYYSKTGGGPVANEGAVYAIVSPYAAGEGPGPGTYDHPAIVKTFHEESSERPTVQTSMVVDIQGDLMDVHVLRHDGFVVDAWQIRKTAP